MGRPYRRIRPRPVAPVEPRPQASLKELESRIGYAFRNPALLAEALTHQSALEGTGQTGESYQRLEFLGDRVLGLVVADMLCALKPRIAVGRLARRLSDLVRAETCAEVAQEWALADHIRFGPNVGAETRASRSVAADICEAVLGAAYLDGGFEAAQKLVRAFWTQRLHDSSATRQDAKTALQEWAQARGLPPPGYTDLERSGPDHDPLFRVQVDLPGYEPAQGHASAKKYAQQSAAETFLLREGIWATPSRHRPTTAP